MAVAGIRDANHLSIRQLTYRSWVLSPRDKYAIH